MAQNVSPHSFGSSRKTNGGVTGGSKDAHSVSKRYVSNYLEKKKIVANHFLWIFTSSESSQS